MSNQMDELLKNINECCRKIAQRDGFELPPVGGYVKKPDVRFTNLCVLFYAE
jgi:hypothetical protein